MQYRIQFLDVDDVLNEVIWYAYDNTDKTYYDFCGTDKPLKITWSGDRYSGLRGSGVKANVIIRHTADKEALDKLLDSSFCLIVKKAGVLFWAGKIAPQFFTEPYRDFPYNINLTASDHLGQFDDKQFLLTDFREPHDWENPQYTVLDFVNKALTTEDIIPKGATDLCAPVFINVATRIYTSGLEHQLLEHTFLDPRVFLSEGDTPIEYENKQEMFDQVLGALELKLFQWAGEWWLMSFDAQWDAGEITYRKFSIDRDAGAVFVSQHTINPEIIELCENDANYNALTSELSYYPSWSGVFLTENFEENKNALPVTSNRDGMHFRGSTDTFLEFGPTVTFPDLYTTVFWWENPLKTCHYWPDINSGNIAINTLLPGPIDREVVLTKQFPIGWSHDINRIIVSVDIALDSHVSTDKPQVSADLVFGLRYRVLGELYDRVINNDGDGYKWVEYSLGPPDPENWSEIMDKSGKLQKHVEVDVPRPGDEVEGYAYLDFTIYEPNTDAFITSDAYYAVYSGIKVDVTSRAWDRAQYKQTASGVFDPIIINPLGVSVVQEYNLKWGISHPDLPNGWVHHLSSPYYTDGRPMDVDFWKSGSPAGIRTLTDWLQDMWQEDNFNYSSKLGANVLETTITPLNLVRDFEDRVNVFVGGTYNCRANTWEGKWTQAKWLRNDPGAPIKGDFRPSEFNDDFYTEPSVEPPPGKTYFWLIGTDAGQYGFWDAPLIGGITPAVYEGEPIHTLATVATDSIKLSLGATYVPGVTQVVLRIPSQSYAIIMSQDIVTDSYVGHQTGLTAYLTANVGSGDIITLETIP